MSEQVLINVGVGETRVAIVKDDRLQEVILERALDDSEIGREGRSGHSILQNIYLGRVQRVLPGMQAAFVEIGLERAGFLGAREAKCLSELQEMIGENLPPISSCVKSNDIVPVQVVKDPINDKGARLSANVTLPGRLLVFVPNQMGVALSRRIEDEDERERLTGLAQTMIDKYCCGPKGGYIMRTAAVSATQEELEDDAKRLHEIWDEIQVKCKTAQPCTLVHADLDPVSRSLRDHTDDDTMRVVIDDAKAFAEAKRYCLANMPEMLTRLQLHSGPEGLFQLYEIETELENLLQPRAQLDCGGWITIETTEALTAVDVNSGSFTDAHGLEETSFTTNMSAARELVRQLRLRGVGGLIVVDFIHMDKPENIEKLIETLEEGFATDRSPTQISSMSEFGLVEMTRKRTREPLDRLLTEKCNSCDGQARVKTVATVANALLRRMEREAGNNPGRALRGIASPEVIEWLGAHNPILMTNLRDRIGCPVALQPDSSCRRNDIEVVIDRLDQKAS